MCARMLLAFSAITSGGGSRVTPAKTEATNFDCMSAKIQWLPIEWIRRQ